MKTTNLIDYDRLYGQIEISKEDLEIYQTPQFSRLNRVSLSAIPTWFQPTGICASKAEHSRGVRHLAKLLTQNKSFKKDRQNIILAATLHDIGTPPFSHLSEPFQIEITGKNHEEFSREMIINTQVNQIIKKQKGNLAIILKLIEGKHPPLSDLVNGTIDLDNLDNTLRFGQSMGLIDAKDYYSPELIIKAFIKKENGSIALQAKYLPAINSWEKCRHTVYQYVYSHSNLAPGSMLSRALYFAQKAGELKASFFKKTNDEALNYLLGCNPQSYNLVNQVIHWQFFKPVFSFNRPVSQAKGIHHNMMLSQKLADQLAKDLKIKPVDLSVDISFNKGFKKIHLPFIGDQKTFNHQPNQPPTLFFNLYLNPKLKLNTKKTNSAVKEILKHQKILKAG